MKTKTTFGFSCAKTDDAVKIINKNTKDIFVLIVIFSPKAVWLFYKKE